MLKHNRIAAWWYALEDLNWPGTDGLEKIRRTAADLAESDTDTVILYGCHFRWDWLPYFTILHDYLATIAEELHKYNIKLIDHHSVNLVHRYSSAEEMRRCIVHSGPHIPFSPDREAAASWAYHGKLLNNWRMIDVTTGAPLQYPQYSAEGFCHRNPDFIRSYLDYAKRLVADTKIDGLMADDAVHYMHMRSCGCPHCRKALKERTGIDLPPIEDRSFWGNFDNENFLAWLDLRLDACGDFYEKLRKVLPEDFILTACGNNSATATAVSQAADVRQFLRGCNYANLELVGNTPAYFPDKVTVNRSILSKITAASLHAGVARKKGAGCFGTGYGFSEDSANVIWAVNKFLGADCYMSTLKPRLGLRRAELDKLPTEAALVKTAFSFEKAHPELFDGASAACVGVYFSYETRNHTLFGGTAKGMVQDFSQTLSLLLSRGICADTVTEFPGDASTYRVIILPSARRFTEAEQAALDAYLNGGGKVYAMGPCGIPGAPDPWQFPNRPDCTPEGFFSTIRDGVWHKPAPWVAETEFKTPDGDFAPVTLRKNLIYDPRRIGDAEAAAALSETLKRDLAGQDTEILHQQGYFVSSFHADGGTVLHFLAGEFDTEIDEQADAVRFHRSRVNLITRATAKNVDREICLRTEKTLTVYLPFGGEAQTERTGDTVKITLPEHTGYAIIKLI